jgi:hypothetical protein
MRQPRSQVLAILSLLTNFAKVRVAHRAVRKGQAHLRVFFAVAHVSVWRSAFSVQRSAFGVWRSAFSVAVLSADTRSRRPPSLRCESLKEAQFSNTFFRMILDAFRYGRRSESANVDSRSRRGHRDFFAADLSYRVSPAHLQRDAELFKIGVSIPGLTKSLSGPFE